MKVEKIVKPEPVKFKPVTLEVTFESRDEVRKLKETLGPLGHSYNLYNALCKELENQ